MLGLLKTLWRPDQEEDPAKTIIARAANTLQVGEFQLLQLAYYEWHGENMPEAICDGIFRAYMLHGEVPAWGRHYARKVLRAAAEGQLQDSDPDLHRYDHDYVTQVPNGVRHFVIASMCLALFFVSALVIGGTTGIKTTSVLPPYFEADHLKGGAEGSVGWGRAEDVGETPGALVEPAQD